LACGGAGSRRANVLLELDLVLLLLCDLQNLAREALRDDVTLAVGVAVLVVVIVVGGGDGAFLLALGAGRLDADRVVGEELFVEREGVVAAGGTGGGGGRGVLGHGDDGCVGQKGLEDGEVSVHFSYGFVLNGMT